VTDLSLLQRIEPKYNTARIDGGEANVLRQSQAKRPSRPALRSSSPADLHSTSADLHSNWPGVNRTMEGTRSEPATAAHSDAAVRPGQGWLIESQSLDAGLSVDDEPMSSARNLRLVESGYITLAILGSVAFLYASTVPWIFASPDFDTRIAGVLRSWHWNPVTQPLDPAANVLAFIPVGFLWSAAWQASLKRRPRRIEAVQVALGCLLLAVVAETLQFWIPLRDPSIRDVLSLECGAVLGCGLWAALGEGATRRLCQLADGWLAVRPRSPRFHLPLQLAIAFTASLVLVRVANPIRLFLAYREYSSSLQHLPISQPSLGPSQPHGLVAIVSVSAVAAVLLVGICRTGQGTIRALKGRDPGR